MLTRFLLITLCLIVTPLSANTSQSGIFAKIHTDKGIITAKLFYQQAPMTVMNFIGLSEGTIAWQDPETKKQVTKPLYQNLIFHHVREFMVQTGDPTGTGANGPGFVFADEFHPDLSHSKAGTLSMATKGPNTNGSQFIITNQPAQWLDNHHSIFGEVVENLDIVSQLKLKDKLIKITISRVGDEAKKFDAKQAHKLAKVNQEVLRKASEKILPSDLGQLDPARVPSPEQPPVSPGDFEFIVIGHTNMKVSIPGKQFYYDHKAALAFAKQLVRHARSKDVDFDKLIKQYSDMERNVLTKNVKDDPSTPAPMKIIFRLKPGQISEPLDSPMGVYIFHRL
ncbi:peptidylprolyl isomerase [Candidatus Halobeggiatoa sp. HSG11]|nr:peptidylprolyl isomerase [Candidatus Halobeggiatoa sp. HSG11]